MGKGSQLTQLKSALSQAGLNRQPQPSKKRKHSTATREAKDKDKKAQKLSEIQRKLNPFDVKVTKLKHDVGGRKLKGTSGRPQESKQAGLEKRKKTLLKEYEEKNHAGGIIDRRFGENDPTMAPEERMLERFTKERQRASRGAVFNLEDEDELTHYGQSLSKMDDFDDAGIMLDDDDESDGKIDMQTVKAAHFGGFSDEDEDDGEPPRKKSKAEVMAEVIAKSKQHKFERQAQRQQDADTRHQLDQELDDIRHLLFSGDSTDAATSKLERDIKDDDQGYDQHVRELALDQRAKPKDRTKTEEELALEAKEALEKAERKRQKRMLGEEDDSSDGETTKRKRARREVGGDDLEDDFDDDNAETWDSFGAGLGESVSDDETENNVENEEDENEGETDEESSNDEDMDSEEANDEESEGEIGLVTHLSKIKSLSKGKGREVRRELPYTFPCPDALEDFLEITEDIDAQDISTVIDRIRALYHPSLGVDNKYKLQTFARILIEYILHVSSPPDPSFATLPSLLPHLHSLTHSYPTETANHFISKLKLMHKNLTRGLGKGALSPDSRTWPGLSELALLWTISHIWPTSDMNHHVISPSRLLMCSYLGLCRIRSLRDMASCLFLCTLFLRYEKVSKRLIPEAINSVLTVALLLSPNNFKDEDTLPGTFPCPDFDDASTKNLRLNKKKAKSMHPSTPDLIKILASIDDNTEQAKLDLLTVALKLIVSFAEMYKGLDGFIELFQPAFDVLEGLRLDWASETVKTKLLTTKDMIARLLKFARQSRRPLALQSHKPIPIATYIPKFEGNSSSYIRNRDPDQERAAASKLRYQLKQERKGAIRELRKDARFLSAVRQKEQQEKDRTYSERMNKVFSSLEGERAEQKKMDREKAKEKKRSGGK